MANTKIQSEQIADDVALAGSPTTTTQSASDNSTKVATTAYVTTAVANLVDSAPSSLNTLNELAAAMNDNASFFSTVLPLSGGTMTGNISHASDFTLDVGGDIILDADGGDVYLKDDGTTFLQFKHHTSTDIYSIVSDNDLKLIVRDGSSNVEALVFDAANGGNATFSGSVTADDLTVESNASSSVPTFTLKDTDTSISVGQSLGRLSFSSADASPDAAGERAFIRGYLIDGTNYGIDIGAMASSGSPTKRLTVSGSGDISFYDGSGNAGFFWDSSAAAFRVGSTSAIFTNSVISGVSALGPTIGAKQTTAAQSAGGFWNSASGDVALASFFAGSSGNQIGSISGNSTSVSLLGSGGNGLTVTSAGNVGIGVNLPASSAGFEPKLAIHGSGSPGIIFKDTDTAQENVVGTNGAGLFIDSAGHATATNNKIIFRTASSNSSFTMSDAMTIDSSQNVSVGSSSLSNLVFDLKGSNTGTNAAANAHMASELRMFNLSATDNNVNGIGFYNSNELVAARIAGTHTSHSSRNGEIAFLTHNGSALNEAMRIRADSNVALNQGSLIIPAGYGIHFGAATTSVTGTSVASTVLDDYEEGTWTPVFKDNGSTTIGVTINNCRYVKVGQVVHVNAQVTKNDSTSLSNYLRVEGLPFTSHGSTTTMSGGAWFDGTGTDEVSFCYVYNGYIYFKKVGSNSDYVTTNQFQNARPVYFATTYMANN